VLERPAIAVVDRGLSLLDTDDARFLSRLEEGLEPPSPTLR
jgi:hypothetical protein